MKKLFEIWQEDHPTVHYTDDDKAEKIADIVAGLIDNGKVLDIGAADGRLVAHLQKRGFDAYGVTLGETNVEYAKKTFKIGLDIMDMHDLKYGNSIFDAVTSLHTLEHAVSPWIATFEMWRITKDYGYVVVEVPAVNTEHGCIDHRHKGYLGQYYSQLFYQLGFVIKDGSDLENSFFILEKQPIEKIPHSDVRTRVERILRER